MRRVWRERRGGWRTRRWCNVCLMKVVGLLTHQVDKCWDVKLSRDVQPGSSCSSSSCACSSMFITFLWLKLGSVGTSIWFVYVFFYTPVLHLSRWRGISNKTCLMDSIVQASAWQLLLRGFFWLGSQKMSVLNRERFSEFKIKKTKKEEIPHDCGIVGSWIHSTLQEMQTTDELDFNHLPLSCSKGAAEPHLAFHFSSLLRNRIRTEAFCGSRLDERDIRRHQTEQGSTKILCSSSFSGEVLLEASRWEWKCAWPGDSSSWMRNLISVLKIQRQKVEEMLKLQIEWWWFGSCACIKI